MSKVKFYFNTKSLTYERIQVKWIDRIKKFLTYLATGIVFAVVTLLIAYRFIDSPKEKQLKREIQQMSYNYEDLNQRLEQMTYVLNDMQ
ncbi:MAG: M23 family peptidase, partial [Bacteroidia bacterium]